MGIRKQQTFHGRYRKVLLTVLLASAGWGAMAAPEGVPPGSAPPVKPAWAVTLPGTDVPGALIIHSFAPKYPRELAEAGETGMVILVVRVSAEGEVAIEVEKSSRFQSLDTLAVETLSRWTFRPAIVGGKPVYSAIRIPIEFLPR